MYQVALLFMHNFLWSLLFLVQPFRQGRYSNWTQLGTKQRDFSKRHAAPKWSVAAASFTRGSGENSWTVKLASWDWETNHVEDMDYFGIKSEPNMELRAYLRLTWWCSFRFLNISDVQLWRRLKRGSIIQAHWAALRSSWGHADCFGRSRHRSCWKLRMKTREKRRTLI